MDAGSLLWQEIQDTFLIDFLPKAWLFILELILAIIVFIVGWFIAVGIGKLIAEILKRLKFDQIFERSGWKSALEKAEIKIQPSGFIGAVVKWILIIIVLQLSVGVLGWASFEGLLDRVIGYIPNVVIAVLIFVVTVIIVDILEKVVRAAVERSNVGYGHIASVIVKWSVWIFALMIILEQLGIAENFMKTMYTGLIGFLVISLGLAFGLGGKDVAAEFLQDFKKKIRG